jgi:hypothetical protein
MASERERAKEEYLVLREQKLKVEKKNSKKASKKKL